MVVVVFTDVIARVGEVSPSVRLAKASTKDVLKKLSKCGILEKEMRRLPLFLLGCCGSGLGQLQRPWSTWLADRCLVTKTQARKTPQSVLFQSPGLSPSQSLVQFPGQSPVLAPICWG